MHDKDDNLQDVILSIILAATILAFLFWGADYINSCSPYHYNLGKLK